MTLILSSDSCHFSSFVFKYPVVCNSTVMQWRIQNFLGTIFLSISWDSFWKNRSSIPQLSVGATKFAIFLNCEVIIDSDYFHPILYLSDQNSKVWLKGPFTRRDFFLSATAFFTSHGMGCTDANDTVHTVRPRLD